jgi:hypothetical protein
VPWYVTRPGDDLEDVVSSFMWYIRRQVNLVAPPGYRDSQHATYRVFGQLAAGMSEEKALEELTRHRMIVLSDVEGSRKAMEEFFAAGATDLVGQFEVGGLPHEYTVAAMQTFARDVAGFAK